MVQDTKNDSQLVRQTLILIRQTVSFNELLLTKLKTSINFSYFQHQRNLKYNFH